jgi:hypothetical protein
MAVSRRKLLTVVGLVLSHLACVGLGAGVVGYMVHGARMAYLDHRMALGWAGENARMQFDYGTPEVAASAQTKYLEAMERARPYLEDWEYHGDRVVALAKLAEIARGRGDEAGARRYLDEAMKDCKGVPWGNGCTDERLRKLALRGTNREASAK